MQAELQGRTSDGPKSAALKLGGQAAAEKPKTSHGAKPDPKKMTERERLQASLRQTLTEFKES